MFRQVPQAQAEPLAAGDFLRILDLLPGQADDLIQCDLRVVSLGDQIQYETLSYVWGHHSKMIIRIAGLQFSVTMNLYSALKQLRHPSSKRALWIDQLCINQQDDDEKAHQVDMMRRIYKECTRCLIWLGNILEGGGFSILDAKAAFDYISVLSGDTREELLAFNSSRMSTMALDGVCVALRALMLNGNPWWSRIWTVQEAVLTKEATILWGHLTLPLDTLEIAAFNLCRGIRPHRIQHIIDRLHPYHSDFTGPVRGLSIARAGENPLNVLQRWRHREATDPRDKVYALIGLFPSSPFPSVQSCKYDISPAELFAKVTRDLIELETGLRAFVGRRGEPHVTKDLPTWALDLVRFPEGKQRAWKWWNNSHRYRKFNACGSKQLMLGMSKDPQILSLTGVYTDEIKAVGEVLRENTFGELPDEQVISMINSWEQLLVQFLYRQATAVSSRYRSWPNAFARTILGDFIMKEFPVRRVTDRDLFDLKAFRDTRIRGSSYTSLRDMVVKQAFFITKTGYLGLGPPNVLQGDEVWILFGGQVPFILRRRGRGNPESIGTPTAHEYFFVGDTYVCGIMDGEAVEHLEDRQATIHLY